MNSSVNLSIIARPDDTTVRLHQPDVAYDARPRHITSLVIGDSASITFTFPADALAWLQHCINIVTDAVDEQAAEVHEDAVIAEANLQ